MIIDLIILIILTTSGDFSQFAPVRNSRFSPVSSWCTPWVTDEKVLDSIVTKRQFFLDRAHTVVSSCVDDKRNLHRARDQQCGLLP